MGEHTGLPWRFVPSHVAEGDAEVRHPDGWLICCVPSDELAKCVVHSINTQPAVADLVKALDDLDVLLDFGNDDLGHVWEFEDTTAIQAAFKQAYAALSRFRELEKENG